MTASTITPDNLTYSYLLRDINHYLPIARNHAKLGQINDKDLEKKFKPYLSGEKDAQKQKKSSKKEIRLPKTYSTKKGPLLLVSKNMQRIIDTRKNERLKTEYEMPIKTVSDLQMNVLFYGINERTKTSLPNSMQNIEKPIQKIEAKPEIQTEESEKLKNYTEQANDFKLLTLVNLSQKDLIENVVEKDTSDIDFNMKRINRGYSARRYLSNLTRHWDEKLLENLIDKGKLRENTIFDMKNESTGNHSHHHKRKRIDDDLSTIPPAYRINKSLLLETGDLSGYKFFKAHDCDLFDMFDLEDAKTESIDDRSLKCKTPDHSYYEQIKVCDPHGMELTYASLQQNEKENVLSELLFQSALQNITEQQIKSIEMDVKEKDQILMQRNKESNVEVKRTLIHKIEMETMKTVHDFKRSNTCIDHDHHTSAYKRVEMYEAYEMEAQLKAENYKPIVKQQDRTYMFGKLNGARWVNKKQTAEDFKDVNMPLGDTEKHRASKQLPKPAPHKVFKSKTNIAMSSGMKDNRHIGNVFELHSYKKELNKLKSSPLNNSMDLEQVKTEQNVLTHMANIVERSNTGFGSTYAVFDSNTRQSTFLFREATNLILIEEDKNKVVAIEPQTVETNVSENFVENIKPENYAIVEQDNQVFEQLDDLPESRVWPIDEAIVGVNEPLNKNPEFKVFEFPIKKSISQNERKIFQMTKSHTTLFLKSKTDHIVHASNSLSNHKLLELDDVIEPLKINKKMLLPSKNRAATACVFKNEQNVDRDEMNVFKLEIYKNENHVIDSIDKDETDTAKPINPPESQRSCKLVDLYFNGDFEADHLKRPQVQLDVIESYKDKFVNDYLKAKAKTELLGPITRNEPSIIQKQVSKEIDKDIQQIKEAEWKSNTNNGDNVINIVMPTLNNLQSPSYKQRFGAKKNLLVPIARDTASNATSDDLILTSRKSDIDRLNEIETDFKELKRVIQSDEKSFEDDLKFPPTIEELYDDDDDENDPVIHEQNRIMNLNMEQPQRKHSNVKLKGSTKFTQREKALEKLKKEASSKTYPRSLLNAEDLGAWKTWNAAKSKTFINESTGLRIDFFKAYKKAEKSVIDSDGMSSLLSFNSDDRLTELEEAKISERLATTTSPVSQKNVVYERPKTVAYENTIWSLDKITEVTPINEKLTDSIANFNFDDDEDDEDNRIKTRENSLFYEKPYKTASNNRRVKTGIEFKYRKRKNQSSAPAYTSYAKQYLAEKGEGDSQGYTPLKSSRPFHDKIIKRTIDWSHGAFDPRELFTIWTYENQTRTELDKGYIRALRRYAQLIARTALNFGGGLSLSLDIKRALDENFSKLRKAILYGKINKETMEEYKKILKQTLARNMKKKELEDLEIDDETLMELLELPPEAFEVFRDPITDRDILRVNPEYLAKKRKTTIKIETDTDLNSNDFEKIIDPFTGQTKTKLKHEIAEILGIAEEDEDLFELYVDQKGHEKVRLKIGQDAMKTRNVTYRVVSDENTGKQSLKMIVEQEIDKENVEDILKISKNMPTEDKARYLQNVIKSIGDEISDNTRKAVIDQIMINAMDLPEDKREYLLQDLMETLITDLPNDMAHKVVDDIMKSTEHFDPIVKQHMIQNMVQNISVLPEEVIGIALSAIIKNLDDLPSDTKHNLLEDILHKVDEINSGDEGETSRSDDLKNSIFKEIISNAKYLEPERRDKILEEVIEKVIHSRTRGSLGTDQHENGTQQQKPHDIPDVILTELVKQMGVLPTIVKTAVLEEIVKNAEKGEIAACVFEEVLRNAESMPLDIIDAVLNAADESNPEIMKEIVKNMDKLPDEYQEKVMTDMLNNIDMLDSSVKHEVLKSFLSNTNIGSTDVREKLIENIVHTLGADEVIRETGTMSPEQKNEFYQTLLRRASLMNDATREKIVGEMLKNSENLGVEESKTVLDTFLKTVNELPSDVASKIVNDIIKGSRRLSSTNREYLINNLLNNMDNFTPEVKHQTLNAVIKNVDKLKFDDKQKFLGSLLNKLDDLPPELKEQTLNTLISNVGDLPSDKKQQFLQNILSKVEDGRINKKVKIQLKDNVYKEIIKNAKKLDEKTRAAVLENVIESMQAQAETSDVDIGESAAMTELVKEMDTLPSKIKNTVMKEVSKSMKKGKLGPKVLKEILNSGNVPPEVFQEITKNAKFMTSSNMKELVKNLKAVPAKHKKRLLKTMIHNVKELDNDVKKSLFKEILTKTDLFDSTESKEEAIRNMMKSMGDLPEDVRIKMLSDLADNIDSVSEAFREQLVKDLLYKVKSASEKSRRKVLKRLLKKLGRIELEGIVKKMELTGQERLKLLYEIKNLIDTEDDWSTDDDSDEEYVVTLLPEREMLRKQQRDDKKRVKAVKVIPKPEEPIVPNIYENPNTKWKEMLRKEEHDRALSSIYQLSKDPTFFKAPTEVADEPITLNHEQTVIVESFKKLTNDEKQEFLRTLTTDQKDDFIKLQKEYTDLARIKREAEIRAALEEIKAQAIKRIRDKLAYERQFFMMNLSHREAFGFNHTQQITRAFVFSYFDLLNWLNINDPSLASKTKVKAKPQPPRI